MLRHVLKFIRNLNREDTLDTYEQTRCVDTYEQTRCVDTVQSVEEINFANHLWLQCVQEGFYEHGMFKQLSVSFRLFKDEFSLLQSKTRLCEATDIGMRAKFSLVLSG